MFKIGDKVILPYDDQPENQCIIGKVVTVVKEPDMNFSTWWMDVELDGIQYSVRGSECRRAPNK
jgi:hypothetical protein